MGLRPYLLLFFFLLFNVSVDAADDAMLKQTIKDAVLNDDLLGLAVAIVRDGKIAMVETYGVKELGKPDLINSQTRFRIASLSKSFAGALALQLEAEDRLSLDDPIISYSPEFRLKNKTQAEYASLTHVLSHRLSLPPYAYDNLLESGIAPTKILGEMKKVEPICNVGSCYAYQNVGFNMIASAIERADNQPYSVAVSERIFKPLNMNGASLGKQSLIKDDNWARSYSRRRYGPWRSVSVKQPYYDVPAAGGINANILDMAKWLAAQMGYKPSVLSKTLLDRQQTPLVKTRSELRRTRHLGKVKQAHYGLGWRIYDYAGARLVNHSGSVEGYGAQIAFLPEHDAGIVLLTNSKSRAFWKILPVFLNQELNLVQADQCTDNCAD